jgi:MFS family permease
MFFLRQREVLVNLCVMIIIWMAASFNFYLINFQLKYWKGNVYVNSYIYSLASVVAYATSGFVYQKIGGRLSFIIYFTLATIGGLLICLFGYGENLAGWVFPCLVLVASFGIASAFNLVYASHSATFPTLFCASAMGICNFVARVATIFAPEVSEIPGNTAMWIFTIISAMSLVGAFFLKKIKKEETGQKNQKKKRSWSKSD